MRNTIRQIGRKLTKKQLFNSLSLYAAMSDKPEDAVKKIELLTSVKKDKK